MLKPALSEKTLTEVAKGTFLFGSQLPKEADLRQILVVFYTIVRDVSGLWKEDRSNGLASESLS